MTKTDILTLYRNYRKENGNRKPNRVIVRIHWKDEPDNSLVDTIAIVPQRYIDNGDTFRADCWILYYISSLKGLLELTKPDNGSHFVVEEVLEFYKLGR